MPNYEIIQDIPIQCQLVDIKEKDNFWVLIFANSQNYEVICHVLREKDKMLQRNFDAIVNAMINKSDFIIHRVAIKSNVGVYHIYTWVDVDNNICKPWQVGMVQRDENNKPIEYSIVVVYGNLRDKGKPNVGNVFLKEYVEKNTPEADAALAFKGRLYLKEEDDDYYDDDSEQDYYDPYIADEYRRSMSEEDAIMDALENGNGEYYGY